MNKNDLIKSVAQQTGCPAEDVKNVINCMFGTITQQLGTGEKVAIQDFGTFEVVERAERAYFNPTLSDIGIAPAHNAVKFRASKRLKTSV